ncbi:MAG: MBL fold metallo-hydrolase [Ignavibacteria bacterium]|nr:MBL fold metallo-hydrolase [Ignavibacteria bacterium]
MSTRRRFLSLLGLSLVSAPVLQAQSRELKRSRWDLMFHNEDPRDPDLRPDPSSWDDHTITAAWIGHATVLINFFGTWIVTDPVLSERIGVDVLRLFTVGPKRLVRPALQFDDLPPIDLVLLSHGHMDHMDTPTIRLFNRDTPVVIAKHTLDIIEDYGFQEIYELDWNEYAQIGDVRIEALEVRHFGWRFPWEEDRSRGNPAGRSYNAYLISKNGKHLLFGGDTAYQEYFRKLGERGIPIELAMMPIGAYDPWIHSHANPEQALEMCGHMNARAMMPIHWNTFIQSDEPTAEPMQRLLAAAGDDRPSVALTRIGETWRMES